MQRVFWRAVRFDPAPPEVDRLFVSRGALSGRERMALYRRMYWYRQVDALFETFPVLAARLGEETFTKLACAFVNAYPSEHHALEHLGARLPSFMRERGDAFVDAGCSLWADVAELEWAECAALIAPAPSAVATLADLPFEQFTAARLEFVPSLVPCTVGPRARAIVHDDDRTNGDSPEQGAEPRTVIVWRPDFHLRERLLESDEALALERARRGATLDDVCSAFCDASDPTDRAVRVLCRWVSDSLVVRAIVRGERS